MMNTWNRVEIRNQILGTLLTSAVLTVLLVVAAYAVHAAGLVLTVPRGIS